MKRGKRLSAFILIVILGAVVGCDESGITDELQTKASGDPGEVILVMDSAHWRTELGDEITQTFRSEVLGLPRPEPLFTVRYIKPTEFRSILRYARNIIIVAVLDNYSSESERVKNFFTPNSIDIIKENPDLFILPQKDTWARGQEVLYMFSNTEAGLTQKIAENREVLRAHFNNIEKRRLASGLYAAKELRQVGQLLLENHNFSLRVPFGWRIEYEQQNSPFIWIRNPGLEVDKNLWIYYQDYTSDQIFTNVSDFRNRITRKYIFEDKERNDTSYVVIQPEIPPVDKTINFRDKYAVESRGLWKTNNNSMGGPYVSYVFVDESLNRVYYIDGFVYSPGKSQRELVRELETILWTFKTEGEVAASSSP